MPATGAAVTAGMALRGSSAPGAREVRDDPAAGAIVAALPADALVGSPAARLPVAAAAGWEPVALPEAGDAPVVAGPLHVVNATSASAAPGRIAAAMIRCMTTSPFAPVARRYS